jgi:hypothetical protein
VKTPEKGRRKKQADTHNETGTLKERKGEKKAEARERQRHRRRQTD